MLQQGSDSTYTVPMAPEDINKDFDLYADVPPSDNEMELNAEKKADFSF